MTLLCRYSFARTARRFVRCVKCLGGIALTLACGDEVRVEIYPETLQVEAETTTPLEVTIAAHVRGKKGNVLNDEIRWEVPDAGPFTISPTTGSQVTLTIKAGVAAGTASQFTARSGSRHATTSVTFVRNSNPATTDMARAGHVPLGFPSVALVSGKRGDCQAHVVVAFVGVAELGDYTSGVGDCLFTERAVVFSQVRSPRFYAPAEWTSGSPFNEFTAPTPPPPPTDTPSPRIPGFTPLRIKAHALGVNLEEMKALLADGIGLARALYTEGLAGIDFDLDPNIDVRPADGFFEHVRECDAIYDQIAVYADLIDETSLHLYFVNKIIWSYRGLWCAKATIPGPYPRNVILISMADRALTTIAHEIGHALAQSEPWAWRGHADQVKGMSSDNLMWAGLEHDQADSRWRIGIGQVFRMYQDRRSWFNAPYVPTGLSCGCDPYSTLTCPKLSAEVLTPLDKGARIQGAVCP